MRLYFDVGNTRLKWALDSHEGPVDSGYIDYRKDGMSSLNLPQELTLDSIWASCVASSEVRVMIDGWVSERFGLPVEWSAVCKQQCGVVNGYEALNQLGVDRWMAVLGAKHYLLNNALQGSSVIIVDAGTAVTVDALSAESEFKGGVILPGLVMMHDALVGRTAGIASSLSGDVPVVGANTQECVNSGVRYGFLGAVDRVVAEVLHDLSLSESDVVLLLTGGDANLLADALSSYVGKFRVCEVLPMLVIDGLRCVANSGGSK